MGQSCSGPLENHDLSEDEVKVLYHQLKQIQIERFQNRSVHHGTDQQRQLASRKPLPQQEPMDSETEYENHEDSPKSTLDTPLPPPKQLSIDALLEMIAQHLNVRPYMEPDKYLLSPYRVEEAWVYQDSILLQSSNHRERMKENNPVMSARQAGSTFTPRMDMTESKRFCPDSRAYSWSSSMSIHDDDSCSSMALHGRYYPQLFFPREQLQPREIYRRRDGRVRTRGDKGHACDQSIVSESSGIGSEVTVKIDNLDRYSKSKSGCPTHNLKVVQNRLRDDPCKMKYHHYNNKNSKNRLVLNPISRNLTGFRSNLKMHDNENDDDISEITASVESMHGLERFKDISVGSSSSKEMCPYSPSYNLLQRGYENINREASPTLSTVDSHHDCLMIPDDSENKMLRSVQDWDDDWDWHATLTKVPPPRVEASLESKDAGCVVLSPDDFLCNSVSPRVRCTFFEDSSYVGQGPLLTSNRIQLSMKAHLAKIFEEEFLMAFPQYPIPRGMIMTTTSSNLSQSRHLRLRKNSEDVSTPTFYHVGSTIVQLTVDSSSFLDIVIHGSLGLTHRPSKQPTPTGMTSSSYKGEMRSNSNHKSKKPFLVIANRKTGEPIAICAIRKHNDEPMVRIFATKPRHPLQKAASTTHELGITPAEPFFNQTSPSSRNTSSTMNQKWALPKSASSSYPLYAWAELVSEGDKFPSENARYSLYMATGYEEGRFEPQPQLIATHVMPGSPELIIFGPSMNENTDRISCQFRSNNHQDIESLEPCAVVMLKTHESSPDVSSIRDRVMLTSHESSKTVERNENTSYEISIARGIDPILVLCMTAVIDEVTEYLMVRAVLSR